MIEAGTLFKRSVEPVGYKKDKLSETVPICVQFVGGRFLNRQTSNINVRYMKKIKITAIRKIQYDDLMAKYENPIEHTCDVREGQSWISIDGQCPENLCPEAWKTMKEFVEALARGEGDFYDGWMKNPYSAMISCNDGFRPVSFYIEAVE